MDSNYFPPEKSKQEALLKSRVARAAFLVAITVFAGAETAPAFAAPPPAPIINFANFTSSTEVNININPNTTQTLYKFEIERSNSATGPFNLVSSVTSATPLSENFSGGDHLPAPVPAGTKYYYRAYTINPSSEKSPPSNVTSATMPGIPAAPSNVVVTRTFFNEIDLAWTDNSNNEDGFILERSLSATSGFVMVNKAYPHDPDSLTYTVNSYFPDRGLSPNTTYYYRVKAINHVSGSSAYSPVISKKTLSSISVADRQGNLFIVITHRGTPLPADGVDYICNATDPAKNISILNKWMKDEANKYAMPKPFSSISCASSQIALPSTLWPGGILDQAAAINYLENNAAVASSISSAKYVAVVHYLPSNTGSVFSNPQNSKYLFDYMTVANYQDMLSLYHSRKVAHELMHMQNENVTIVSDKYLMDPSQACATNPKTGKEYNGYDIMCHRVYLSPGLYAHPDFEHLVVTEDTAKEAKYIGDLSTDGSRNIFDLQMCADSVLGNITDPGIKFRSDINGSSNGASADIFDLQELADMVLNEN